MTATMRLLDDPAARVRRWRRNGSSVAANVVSVLRQHPEIDMARFELTEDETRAVLELAHAEANRKLELARSSHPSVRAEQEKRNAERTTSMEIRIAASKAAYNRQYGLWGLEFDHCRYLRKPSRLVYSASPTDEFWTAWKSDRQGVTGLGYRPRRTGFRWVVERVVSVPPGVAATIYPWGWCHIDLSAVEPPPTLQ